MKKSVWNEFLEFLNERLTKVTATVSISLLGIIDAVLYIAGKPEVLIVSFYILILSTIIINSIYILTTKKTKPDIVIARTNSLEKIQESRFEEKSGLKYPKLKPLAIIGLALAGIIIIAIFSVPIFKKPVISLVLGTPTPTSTLTLTPTQTPTLTPSSTTTLTPSPKPISDSLYYMIVYDSSLKMDETFHGQKKWQVAENMLVEIMNGLNPRAQYSLVTVGGSNTFDGSDPCGNPTSLALPFSPKGIAYNYLGGLRPQGGGSFYKAYALAKNQLEDLSKDTIRTLIYVTGSSDSCETEDEWTALKNLISFPDSTFGIFSQIIILDDDGIKSKTLADQFNSLSNNNVNAQAPQSISEIQSGGVTVVHIVNNVTNYVTNIIAALPTNTPTQTLTPTITATLKPGETRPPTSIPTNTPTFTPTLTKTATPSPVPPTTSICPPASHVFLAGPSYGGSVSINSPGHCSIGQPLETAIYTSGSYSNIPEGTIVWVLAYAPDNLYYPQSPNACAGAPPPNQGGGSWDVNTYLGLPGDPPRWYDLVVVLADQTASDYLTNWLIAGCSSGFPGIDPGVLASMNITEKVYITVQTQ